MATPGTHYRLVGGTDPAGYYRVVAAAGTDTVLVRVADLDGNAVGTDPPTVIRAASLAGFDRIDPPARVRAIDIEDWIVESLGGSPESVHAGTESGGVTDPRVPDRRQDATASSDDTTPSSTGGGWIDLAYPRTTVVAIGVILLGLVALSTDLIAGWIGFLSWIVGMALLLFVTR